MAVLVQTAANVKPSAAAITEKRYVAGATIAAGQPIYLDANSLWQVANANSLTTDATAIAGNSAGVGQPVVAILQDPGFTHGYTGVAAGDTIWGHPSAGGATKTVADLVSTNMTTVLGVAVSATVMKVNFTNAGVPHA